MATSVFEFHWSEYWRWPDDSPLKAKVAALPPILETLPVRTSAHEIPPKTGNHLIVLIEAGIMVVGIGLEESSEILVRERRYMTRKSQGKAQIWHNPRGGRMSYGARLRQRESRAFIKEGVAALATIEREQRDISHVWWHCDPRLKGLLRSENPKLLKKLESHASKLPGQIDIYCTNPIDDAWRRLCFGRFKGE